MVFKEKKKKYFIVFLAFFLFSGAVFVFSSVQSAHANVLTGIILDHYSKKAADDVGTAAVEIAGNTVTFAFKWLLYGVFLFFGWLTSVAVTIFGWAINPAYISGPTGFFNRPEIYELWKFIRDFFNLFFILVLLYIAFTVVFQIQKNFKKALLSLILAALLVNFSFPVSRFLIDVTNVPMYFFVNQMLTDPNNPGETFGTILKASELQKILIPGSETGGNFDSDSVSVARLLAAIVFLFMFSITLLVLAVMLVIRLVALIVLVIFSSVGFAAFIIPGLDTYSKMWWGSFWKYAFFGPAAMLMLLVATRFFSSIAENDATFRNFQNVATGATTNADMSFVASMAFFSIPIIMLWMTIGLASKFSIVGGAMMEGKGKAFAKWAGRKTYNNPVGRGLGGGIKEKYQKSAVGRFISSPSKTEAFTRGVAGTGTVKGALADVHQQASYKRAEEMKKANTSNPDLQSALHGNDKVGATAAAMLLSERKAIDTSNDFTKALEVLGNNTKEVATLIGNASSDALKIDTTTAAGADQYEKVVTSGAFAANPKLREQLEGKMKKEGHAKVLIDHEINKTGASTAPGARQAAYDKYLGKMTAEEVGKAKGIHGDATKPADAELVAFIQNQTIHTNNWTPKEHIDAYSKLNSEQKTAWGAAGIHP